MITTIYLLRHSEPMKVKELKYNESLQIKNEKSILSVEGERRASILSKEQEFKNIDLVISSNYTRAISTAKYFAKENNLDIFINENFGERKFGFCSWEDKPIDFEKKQYDNFDYKYDNGESLNEVGNRMFNELFEVVKNNYNKRVLIVSHGTAITSLFIKIGRMEQGNIYVGEKLIIDKDFKFNAPEVFKLTFKDEKLINIENIRSFNY